MQYLIELISLILLGCTINRVVSDEPERIFGGIIASAGEFPYQVSLRHKNFHFCGGALITNQRILTAAHCVFDKKLTDDFVVATGSIERNGGTTYKIKRIYQHPQYINSVNNSWINDIAVIELEAPIVVGRFQRPISVGQIDPPDGAAVTLTGWGWTNWVPTRPTLLQKMTTFILNKQQCRNQSTISILDTQICAITRRGIGMCTGDSGSPLVYNNEVIGVASWSTGCGNGNADIFTKVTSYLQFINNPERDLLNFHNVIHIKQ